MNFFPERPNIEPRIYAYIDKFDRNCDGLIKVGYTTRNVEERVKEQYPIVKPGKKPYQILFSDSAVRNDGSGFTDKDIHKVLSSRGLHIRGEWFKCSIGDVKSAIIAVRDRVENIENRTESFSMRPEQKDAIHKTVAYFKSYSIESKGKTPHFLWNAKMRFGKTFATYQLAKSLGYKKILVMTFKPAVVSAWEGDLKSHIDFEGWQFITRGGNTTFEQANKSKPIVCFGSFQDFLGKNEVGGIKAKNEWVHTTNWDLVVFDEYHFGAWRENAKELFEAEDAKERDYVIGNGIEYYDEELMPITTGAYLYLSGTPFRAISSGEFIEEQIYNWTYSDEQRAKEAWDDTKKPNPYLPLPRMVLMTYQLPDTVREIASSGQFNEFDLNEFFTAEGTGDKAKFKHEEEVQKWLNLIRGNLTETHLDNLKLGAKKPPMPFSDIRLLNVLSHTLWFLPSVASCHAMSNLLKQKQNVFYHDYNVVVVAGASAGIGVEALKPVQEAMNSPLETKSIALSCGKLTTGITVKPWTGIFMLRNLSTPETYFQSAFRVQSPWVISDGEKDTIVKEECYVFDFAPERALRQIADYGCRLNVDETNPERKVEEFIKFLPVLAYDGSSMKQLDASGILDVAMSGTSATLLARRWESALLVNVDNSTLQKLMSNEQAMSALMNIEGFRNLNQEIETIINKSESVKKTKREANEREISKAEKQALSEEEKEYKSLRKKIQEKLIKFATRIPVFMYLTDFRERSLKDVITKLEPPLFKKVSGLDVRDFELLVSLGVFNSSLMNDAVYKFKRYEDASLAYTGIDKHDGEDVGLWDTSITSREFYEETMKNIG